MRDDIVIIGMAGRFPQAENLEQLHCNLSECRDSVRKMPKQRMKDTALPIDKKYMMAGYLDDIDKFDHKLFGISYKEAIAMDPTQRILLEVVYEAIENSGYSAQHFSSQTTSVIVSEAKTDYYKFAESFSPVLISGVDKEFLATRIAREFRLTGNAMMIDTACSSSLVAIYQACNEMHLGDADCAIVCGANVKVLPYANQENQLDVFSSDGKSKSFSEDANGMSTGETAAAVILKPLEQAKKDKDIIYGVIKGIAVNNNANRSASPTAPDSVAQAEVLEKAWKKAGITPEQVGYLEAHGSGTKLGDNIEADGINLAVSHYTDGKKLFPVSTGKSNLGHAMTASGMVSLCKILLSINKNCIYPIINFERPSTLIDFDNSAFYINVTKSSWKQEKKDERIACISALGVSGTNCHMVVSGYEEENVDTQEQNLNGNQSHLLTITSMNEQGLVRNIDRYIDWFVKSDKAESFQDICFTAQTGRTHYPYRFAVVANNKEQALEKLRKRKHEENLSFVKADKIVFIMSDLDEVSEEWIQELKQSSVIFGKHYSQCESSFGVKNQNTRAFAVQYALYNTLTEMGIRVDNVASIGIGKLVVEAIRGASLTDMEDRVVNYTNDVQNMPERVEKLVKISAEKTTLFVQMGIESELLRLINSNKKYEDVYTLHMDVQSENSILEFTNNLYMYGMDIDFKQGWDGKEVRKVVLPNYSFDKIHCWLRSEPLQSEEESRQQEKKEFLVEANTASLIEKKVAEFFEHALDVEQISLDYDFFQAGGDSLKVTKIITEIKSTMNVDLNFEDLFDFPTIRQFAGYISSILSVEDKIVLVWKMVLNTDSVEMQDNFFELGGHSLLANELLAYTENLLDIEINFEDLYYWPTVEQFTKYIKSKLDGHELVKETETLSSGKEDEKNTTTSDKVETVKEVLKLDNVVPFTDVLFMNCFFNSLMPIVQCFGRDAGTFLSNTVIQYQYDDREKKASVIYNEKMSIPDMLTDAGFEFVGMDINDNFIHKTKEALKEGKAVIASVDCYYLPMRSDTYQKLHRPHTILIYGADFEKQQFIIMEHEHFNSLNYKETYIGFEDILRAYSGYVENLKDNDEGIGFTYLELSRGSKKGMKTEEYKKRYIKNYLDQESEIQRGINQLEIWNKYMSTILADKLKLEEYSRVIEDLTYIINAKKLERYVVRQLFEEEEIQSTMENIVRNWDQVRSTISKFFITKIYRESSMENTVQVIKNIIASEREMLKRMSAIG